MFQGSPKMLSIMGLNCNLMFHRICSKVKKLESWYAGPFESNVSGHSTISLHQLLDEVKSTVLGSREAH